MASNAPSTLRQNAPWIAALLGGLAAIFALGAAGLYFVVNMAATQLAPTSTPLPPPTETPTPQIVAVNPSPTVAAITIITPPPTDTPLPTATPTDTATPTPTATATDTPTATGTATSTPTDTATPTVTPADVNALSALLPVAAEPTMPPDPAEQEFLAASTALMGEIVATIPLLEAQMARASTEPIVLSYGDWARETSNIIARLRELIAQAYALPVPPRYAASWNNVLAGVNLLAVALDQVDEGISLYKLELIGEYQANLDAAKAIFAETVPQIGPLPVVVVSVPTPVVIPVAISGATPTPELIMVSVPADSGPVDPAAVVVTPVSTPAANVCDVCPAKPTPSVNEKGGSDVDVIATATLPVVATAIPTMIPIVTPTPVITPPVAPLLPSGGLGLTLEEWVAVHGQPDGVINGLYLFDRAEQTYSLLVVNGRVATIYVAWRPEFRPDLPVAQGAALNLMPRDSMLLQAATVNAERFVGQYNSPLMASVFADAPYGTNLPGTFSVIYQFAVDGPIFQMILTIGTLEE